MVRWLMLAGSFLTVLPWPVRGEEVRGADLHASTAFYPLVGGVLGAITWAVLVLLYDGLRVPAGASAALALAVLTALTGALHVDGWMDTADGLASRKPPAEALAVMRDSRVGAVGATAGGLLLLGKWSALTAVAGAVPHGWQAAAAAAVPAAGRWAMVLSMRLAPYARSGPGIGAVYAGRIPQWCLAGGLVPAALLAVSVWPAALVGQAREAVVFAVWMCAGTVIVTVVFTAWMRRRFGGMTGDTYGALNELVEWLGWTALSACVLQGMHPEA
jgi:adenosylcobinamide-GDP ribazoletransferase